MSKASPEIISTYRQDNSALTLKWLGKPLKPKEDYRLVRGRGMFVDDVQLPRMVYAAFARSPYAHARIKSIDISRATSVPGVLLVWTGEDLKKRMRPLPQATPPPARNAIDYPLAVDKVRFQGEPVAMVVAESRYAAEDAASQIDVDYEPLPVVVDAEKALEPGAPLVHDEVGTNLIAHVHYKWGDVDYYFQHADMVVEGKFHYHRFTGAPLEPNAVVADYDERMDVMTVYCNNQAPMEWLPQLSAGLNMPYPKVRVVTRDIGGGFGTKLVNYVYMVLTSLASKELRRPVKYVETRTENLQAAAHNAERTCYVSAAVQRDGTVLAIRMKCLDDDGAYARHEPAGMTVWAQVSTGMYRIRALENDFYAVFTNKCPSTSIRGFSRAPHLFMIERMMDRIARKLGMDPAEIRMRNLVRPEDMPYMTPSGGLYDSGNWPEGLRKALEAADYQGWRKRQEELRRQGKYVGIGVVVGSDSAGPNMAQVKMYNPGLPYTSGTEGALVQMTPDGKVRVTLGTSPQGMGHETTAAQVVADVLDVDYDDIYVQTGFDSFTSVYTMHSGTYGSRFAPLGLSAVYLAAARLKEKLAKIAAYVLNCPGGDVVIEGGKAYCRTDPQRSTDLKRIARIAYGNVNEMPPGMEPGLYSIAIFRPPFQNPDENRRANLALTYSYNVHVVVVEIDPETGMPRILNYVALEDSGRIVNPLVVDGQVHGAVAHGLAEALYEKYHYDENGNLLNSNFVDYLAPTALEVPPISVLHTETPSPFTPTGAKGMGEGGGTAVQAVISAVEDALAPLGGELEESHADPEVILRILKGTSS
ncbi:MAG: xanthine dehydrogenase family protein molybdopterin-binding subunit [Conexivisphaera sp.]|jgi:2-furoyl-CoA dehydrogenase large subunit